MHRRTAQHEIGGGDADLGAVLHQPDVVGSGMLTAFVQAMRNGREANGVAVKAVGDAVLHGCHGDFLPVRQDNDASKHPFHLQR